MATNLLPKGQGEEMICSVANYSKFPLLPSSERVSYFLRTCIKPPKGAQSWKLDLMKKLQTMMMDVYITLLSPGKLHLQLSAPGQTLNCCSSSVPLVCIYGVK